MPIPMRGVEQLLLVPKQHRMPCCGDISATVQFVHLLAGGGTHVCESSIDDSLVVNPTPSPAFLLDAPQACFDTANAVCFDVIHDVENYTTCEDDQYVYTWFVTPVAGLTSDEDSIDDANVPVPVVCLDAPGTVELILEVENSYGCSQTTLAQPFTVRDLPDPALTFTQPDGICMPTTVAINATSIGASDFTMSIEDYGTFENFSSRWQALWSSRVTVTWILKCQNAHNPIHFGLRRRRTTENDVLVCSVETTYVAAFGVIPPVAAFSVLLGTRLTFPTDPFNLSMSRKVKPKTSGFLATAIKWFLRGQSTAPIQRHREYLVELAVVNGGAPITPKM